MVIVLAICSTYVYVKHRARIGRQQARESSVPEIPVEPNICYDSVSVDHLTEYDDVISRTRADPQSTYENIMALPPAYENIDAVHVRHGLPLHSMEDETSTVGPSADNIYEDVEPPTTSTAQETSECNIPTKNNIAYAVRPQTTD